MNRGERLTRQPISLPEPRDQAFFQTNGNSLLANEVIRRVGEENLVYAMEYGSFASGGATRSSKHDMIIIVEDAKKFHEKNIETAPRDYPPLSLIPDQLLSLNKSVDSLNKKVKVGFHTFLNRFGFNFYYTRIHEKDQTLSIKYAVISKDNFIKGCNGTLREKEKARIGAFGLYVAGRMQKVALRPLAKGKESQVAEIENAINIARIDGVWFALGLLKDSFTFDDILQKYVSLSYRADIRIEQRDKVKKIIAGSLADYRTMLNPIIDQFIGLGLLTKTEDGRFLKLESLSKKDVNLRILKIKAQTALINYIKNPASAGLFGGIGYAFQKIVRAITSKKLDDKKMV